jgi:hypothetical protein
MEIYMDNLMKSIIGTIESSRPNKKSMILFPQASFAERDGRSYLMAVLFVLRGTSSGLGASQTST